jgi:dihydropteroate synthase
MNNNIATHQSLSQKAQLQLQQKQGSIWLGILNVTPDSFSDGGCYLAEEPLLQQARLLLKEGCHWLDVGAVSTRPGSMPCSAEEEWNRLHFALTLLRLHFPAVPLSADTFRADVLHRVGEMGLADICNDVKAGKEGTMEVAAHFKMGMILMHMQGEPSTMQSNPSYQNCIEDVTNFLANSCTKALQLGVPFVVADPGIGFGKTLEHNKTLLSPEGLKALTQLQFPVCVGLSRKSFLKHWAEPLVLSNPISRDPISKIWENHCISYGAQLIRSHRGPKGVTLETGS